MARKISTMILTVELDCCLCNKKIKKLLCKLQDQENIKSISYDDEKKTVTISGPFSPQRLFKKLCCKACDCILEMEIVKPKPPEPPPEKKPEPIKDKPKDDPPKPAPPTPPVNVTICLAGCVCRCNWDHSCRGCQDGQGGHRPCSCGCGGQYRPCQCHCGRGYVWVGGYPPACVGPSHPQLGHNPTWQLICEDQPATACIVM